MDYTKKLFEYFSNNENCNHIIVSPHVPPVERLANSIEVAMDAVWDEVDINETILGLKTYGEINTLSAKHPEDMTNLISDTFCLSIKGAGRFRISYFTQRGSKAFSMKRIPFVIANCEELNLDRAIVEGVMQKLHAPNGGIIAVFGPSAIANSKFAYAVLKRINTKERKVILVMERELTHLIRHDNSIVVQRELGTDCETMEDCLREGLDMKPDIIFAGDLLLTDSIPSLVRAAETQASIIISLVASERESFLHILKTIFKDQYSILGRRTQDIIKVMPEDNGEISATYAAKTTN